MGINTWDEKINATGYLSPTQSPELPVHNLDYQPEPTAQRFHASQAFVRCMMGPIGSGKSVCCVEELKNIALNVQQPNAQGIRKTRFAVVRNTYPELRSTTIK
ncbi:hypothetical protein, partial [Endozoicomonas sp.]|uniref:hypothetical protein n=1 Tax=Endozoicomonas sp. TaxID=1892382 RepID=UPI00383BDD61